MSEVLPPCPECKSEYAYEMGALLVCPECAHEWNPSDVEAKVDGFGAMNLKSSIVRKA